MCSEVRAAAYRCTCCALDKDTNQGSSVAVLQPERHMLSCAQFQEGVPFVFRKGVICCQACASGPHATKGNSDSHAATIYVGGSYITILCRRWMSKLREYKPCFPSPVLEEDGILKYRFYCYLGVARPTGQETTAIEIVVCYAHRF